MDKFLFLGTLLRRPQDPPLLPRLLGAHFFKKKKIPLAVDLSRPGWPEQIRSACESTLLYLRTGTCCAIKIRRVTMGREEIVENVMAAVEGAIGIVPRKWGNVRSMHLKSTESLALPVYEVLPEMGLKIEWVKEEKVLDPEVVGSLGKKIRKKERIHDIESFNGDDLVEEGTKKRKESTVVKKKRKAMVKLMDKKRSKLIS